MRFAGVLRREPRREEILLVCNAFGILILDFMPTLLVANVYNPAAACISTRYLYTLSRTLWLQTLQMNFQCPYVCSEVNSSSHSFLCPDFFLTKGDGGRIRFPRDESPQYNIHPSPPLPTLLLTHHPSPRLTPPPLPPPPPPPPPNPLHPHTRRHHPHHPRQPPKSNPRPPPRQQNIHNRNASRANRAASEIVDGGGGGGTVGVEVDEEGGV